MAKVGEGDPRWIVSDRDDGQNVGQWHWQEKDITPKAKNLLKSIIHNTPVEGFQVNDIKRVSGEATLLNRKKKTSVLYELSSTLSWQGVFYETSLSGEINLVEIADELKEEDIEVTVHITESVLSREHNKKVRQQIAQEAKKYVILFQEQILTDCEGSTSDKKVQPAVSQSKTADRPKGGQNSKTTMSPSRSVVTTTVALGLVGLVVAGGYFYLTQKSK